MKLQGSKIVARVALAVLAIVVALGTMEVAASRTAHAATSDTVAHHVINGPWYLHPENPTDTPSINSPTSDLMQTGTEFDVQCVSTGNAITSDGNLATDGNGDTAWEYGMNAETGDTGFVSDQGLDTQVTQGKEIAQLAAQGIPGCGSTSSDTTSSPNPTNTQGKIVFYSRLGAAYWALTNAPLNSSDGSIGEGGDTCTWFVSKALLGNGFPADGQWTTSGHHGFIHRVPGSKTAWLSSDLIDHLRSVYDTSYTEISFDNGGFVHVPIEPGDIIAYDLGYRPGSGNPFSPDHLAIVVNVIHDPVNGDYPEVAEWGHSLYYYDQQQGKFSNRLADYAKRGWTWSEVYGMWVQSWYNDVQYGGNPNSENAHKGISIKAYLLHFNF